jgi:endonuclease-3
MVASTQQKRHAKRVVAGLRKAYPDARCSLNFDTPLELLVATILSAQCTDERVNQVTKTLFKKCRTAHDFAGVRLSTLEKAIQSTGFFRNKAKNIQQCCRALIEKHDGQVPADLPSLVQLPGVGRKTANVVLGTAFDIASGVVVDTHVGRLSRRLGLTIENDPVKVERDLMESLPRNAWVDFSHRMIQHGRRVCNARRPDCENCTLEQICPRVGVREMTAARGT